MAPGLGSHFGISRFDLGSVRVKTKHFGEVFDVRNLHFLAFNEPPNPVVARAELGFDLMLGFSLGLSLTIALTYAITLTLRRAHRAQLYRCISVYLILVVWS